MNKFTIYNQDKSQVLEYDNINFNEGYLVDMEDVIHHDAIEGKAEKGHYQTIAEYENGGKDVSWIIDKPYIEHEDAWKEIIPIKIYIEYSENEIKKQNLEKEITQTKELLSNTDYMTLKYVDGLYYNNFPDFFNPLSLICPSECTSISLLFPRHMLSL